MISTETLARPDYPHVARKMMLRFIPRDAQRVLDVGCSTGAFGEALKMDRPVEVWGIEPDLAAAEKAEKLLDHAINSLFDESAPIPDEYFDAVVFNDVLEHIPDPWSALRLAARKLRQNGCVVASIPNIRHCDNLAHILIDKDFRYEQMGIRDKTHLRFFTRISMIRLFEESGYTVSTIEGINEDWWRPSLLRKLAFRLLEKQLEDTKYIQYAIVATPGGA